MTGQRWSWRWWLDGATCGSAGHWRAVATAPPGAWSWQAWPARALPALALMVPLGIMMRFGRPFSGPQLALLGLLASTLVAPQFLPVANLDRVRRGRPPLLDWFPPLRPASWYRFVAVVAGCVFAGVLASALIGFLLPSGVVGPRYPETVVFEVGFRITQGAIDALALGSSGAVALHALNVWRWAARGALVPRQPRG